MINLKKLLSENVLGDLPSSKLMKMKWNPVTEGHDDGHEEDAVEEAAPKMKVEPFQLELKAAIKSLNRFDNMARMANPGGHRKATSAIAKAMKALTGLRHAVRS
tara:strand:- start:11 stop:322 length:312 start_codon:yes stop_codon:yes gene_type:complete